MQQKKQDYNREKGRCKMTEKDPAQERISDAIGTGSAETGEPVDPKEKKGGYLFFTGLFLFAGIFLLVEERLFGWQTEIFGIRGSGVVFGWVCLVFAAWFLYEAIKAAIKQKKSHHS